MRRGQKASVETRAKMSLAQKGRKHSVETRVKIGLASKGRKHTVETRAKLSQFHKGKKITTEARMKISQTLKGRKLSVGHRIKIGQSGRGRKHTAEARAKIGRAHKGLKHTAESRAKMSRSITTAIKEGRHHPERNCISGYFFSPKNNQTIHYRSLLELHWYQLLETMEKVKRYSVEPLIIEYKWEGSVHHYLPDLRIRYTDGTTELIEIKPERRRNNPKDQAKWAAARRWCASRKVPTAFRVVGYEELN